MFLYPLSFIDNHDMPRFQSLNSEPDNLRMAIALLMTSRGIPFDISPSF